MEFVLNPAFAAGAWPGPLADHRSASAGELWLGEAGLATQLEIMLGLPTRHEGTAERAVALIPALAARSGFWSASLVADPFPAAEAVLGMVDSLMLLGWSGAHEGGRLEDLAALLPDLRPGLAGRLTAITAELPESPHLPARVRLAAPLEDFSPCCQALVAELERLGTEVEELGEPRGRPTHIVLIRPTAPLAAAEEVAAWLASEELVNPDRPVVMITPDPVLSGALRRHGLPAIGTRHSTAENALLQVLPLVLAMGSPTPDPRLAADLLSLPASPVPGAVRWKLLRALGEWPAVGSDGWNEARAAALAAMEDPDAQARTEQRLQMIFATMERGAQGVLAREVLDRAAMLAQWVGPHLADPESERTPFWQGAASQLALFQRLVRLSALAELSENHLARLVTLAADATGGPPTGSAQVGMKSLGHPGAMAGPSQTTVWWNFTNAAAGAVRPLSLSRAEREFLARAGVQVPGAGELADRRAAAWLRPVAQTTGCLVLVAPQRDGAGEASFVHPLAEMLEESEEAPFLTSPALRRPIAISGAVAPRRAWTLPAPERRETESPSSMERLVRCPLSWTLHYGAGVRAVDAFSIPEPGDSRLLGSLAHRLIEESLDGGPLAPEEASALVGAAFDREGPRLVATLFQPGLDVLRGSMRDRMAMAAGQLHRHLREAGVTRVTCETQQAVERDGQRVEGRIDLLLEPGPLIVDMKWSGLGYRRTSLEKGTAIQLALYQWAAGGVGVSYFILTTQTMLSASHGAFPSADRVNAPDFREATLEPFWRAWEEAWHELRSGRVTAGGVTEGDAPPPKKDEIGPHGARLTPNCNFCDYATLCGTRFAAATAGGGA